LGPRIVRLGKIDNCIWDACRVGRFPSFEERALGQLPNQVAIITEVIARFIDLSSTIRQMRFFARQPKHFAMKKVAGPFR
jgi:hypothetical protein